MDGLAELEVDGAFRERHGRVGAGAKPAPGRRKLGAAVMALAVAATLIVACKEDPPPQKDAAPPAPPPSAEPPPVDLKTCAGCAAPEPITFSFMGVYSDAACKNPVAQGMVAACTQAKIPAGGGTIRAMIVEPMPGVKTKGAMSMLGVQSAVGPDAPLFVLKGGKCTPQPAGIKRVPTECTTGGRVCHKADATGKATETLSCSSCAVTENRCPTFEATMAYVGVVAAPM